MEEQLSPAEQWARDLESGEFSQGRMRLRRADDTYCCLGVLCETFRRSTGRGEWVQYPDSSEYSFVLAGDPVTAAPPKEVLRWVGLDLAYVSDFWEMNDAKGRSFSEIAVLVRKL